ncbi:MAG TPA: tripartite tricarboxylate transporter substrate binding protein [Xanthobacteraceae bacterium]
MNKTRRRLLALAAGAVALPLRAGHAAAEPYPSRPVHIVLGFPPGGSSDVLARLMAQWLAERLKQPFIIDNRPGAGSNIGAEFVAKANPDGYTLLWSTSANAINATLYDNLNFNFIHDMVAVAAVFRVPNVMEVNPTVPVKTVAEFIAYAKANPGKINFCSGGIGTVAHVAGELFKFMTGVDIRHVPYRGSAPALIDLLGGEVQAMFDLMSTSIENIRAGKLRALAVTTATPSTALPGIPTVAETVPGYDASTWNGISAPAGTSAEIVEAVSSAAAAALADQTFRARLADLGAEPMPMGAPEFGRLIVDETGKWEKVIKFAGIKPG